MGRVLWGAGGGGVGCGKAGRWLACLVCPGALGHEVFDTRPISVLHPLCYAVPAELSLLC